jgi:peptidyl-tRNA hydrolase
VNIFLICHPPFGTSNAINWATVKFWKDYGLSRVILSRESLEEIEEIKKNVPEIELKFLYMAHYAWPIQDDVYSLGLHE